MSDADIKQILTEIGEVKGELGRLTATTEAYQREQSGANKRLDAMDEQFTGDISDIHKRIGRHRADLEEKIYNGDRDQETKREALAATVNEMRDRQTEMSGGWKTLVLLGTAAASVAGLLIGLASLYQSHSP